MDVLAPAMFWNAEIEPLISLIGFLGFRWNADPPLSLKLTCTVSPFAIPASCSVAFGLISLLRLVM